jgi:hypothetical protein
MKGMAGNSRRRLLGGMALALSAGAGAGWLSSRAMRRARHPGRRRICLAGELSVGGFMLFEYPEPTTPCILIRSGSDHVTGTPR